MYKTILKPSIDFGLATLLIIITLPIIFAISLILYLSSGTSPIFIQTRGGKDGVIFKLFKFKTMSNKTDDAGTLLSDDIRLTNFGRFLRKTSLDELPQLFNILKGDMSLIGPRPFMSEYLKIYDNLQMRRHEVKPGITGWAQVNGRNNITWSQKFDLDIWYVDNLGLILDLKIILLTTIKVCTSRDVSKYGLSTTEKFNGNN